MSGEDLEFDLFADGDTTENFRDAIGVAGAEGIDEIIRREAPSSPAPADTTPATPKRTSPTRQSLDESANSGHATPVTTPLIAPALDSALVYLCGAVLCLALPIPEEATRGLRGLWLTRCGHAVRIAFNSSLRGEVITMGAHTVPLLGAVVPRKAGGTYYGTKSNENNAIVVAQALLKGDAVDVQMHEGSEEWVRGVVSGDAVKVAAGGKRRKRKVVTQISYPKETTRYFALRRSRGVWYMGARLLPTSSIQHDLQWDDGDVWQRIITKKNCVQCSGVLREVTALPLPYNDHYWCSLCGKRHALKDGAYHCKSCNFDACKSCSKPLIYQHPPTPAHPASSVLCSLCNEGPFSIDEAHAHWLYTCNFNLLRIPSNEIELKGRVNYSKRLKRAVQEAESLSITSLQDRHLDDNNNDDNDGDAYGLENATTDIQPPDESLHSYCFYEASEDDIQTFFEKKLLSNTRHINTLNKVEVNRQRCGLQLLKKTVEGQFGEEEKLCVVLSTRGQEASALCFACYAARMEAVKWLLRHGAEPDVHLKANLTPLKICRFLGFNTFETIIQAAILCKAPLRIHFSDNNAEYSFTAPSDLLSSRSCTTKSDRLNVWLNAPFASGIQAKFTALSGADPSAFGEAEKKESEATLQDFVEGLSRETPSGPFPEGLKKSALIALRGHVMRSQCIAALEMDMGGLGVQPLFKVQQVAQPVC